MKSKLKNKIEFTHSDGEGYILMRVNGNEDFKPVQEELAISILHHLTTNLIDLVEESGYTINLADKSYKLTKSELLAAIVELSIATSDEFGSFNERSLSYDDGEETNSNDCLESLLD